MRTRTQTRTRTRWTRELLAGLGLGLGLVLFLADSHPDSRNFLSKHLILKKVNFLLKCDEKWFQNEVNGLKCPWQHHKSIILVILLENWFYLYSFSFSPDSFADSRKKHGLGLGLGLVNSKLDSDSDSRKKFASPHPWARRGTCSRGAHGSNYWGSHFSDFSLTT